MDVYRNIFQKWQTVCEHNSNKISTWISFVWCLAWLSCIHRIRLHFCICPERKGPSICILEKRYSCTKGICSDVFRKVKWPICRHIKTTRIYGALPSRKGSLNQYHYKVFTKGYGPKTSAKHPLEKQKGIAASIIAPCEAELVEHIHRASFIAKMWASADQRMIIQHPTVSDGWKIDDKGMYLSYLAPWPSVTSVNNYNWRW